MTPKQDIKFISNPSPNGSGLVGQIGCPWQPVLSLPPSPLSWRLGAGATPLLPMAHTNCMRLCCRHSARNTTQPLSLRRFALYLPESARGHRAYTSTCNFGCRPWNISIRIAECCHDFNGFAAASLRSGGSRRAVGARHITLRPGTESNVSTDGFIAEVLDKSFNFNATSVALP